MEVKSKRMKLIKADEYIAMQEAFGWTLVSKDDLRPDETLVVTMERNPELFSNYKELRSLEKDYNNISRPFPLLTIIFAIIGGVLVGLYFAFKGLVISFAFIYGGLTCFLIALFALAIFIILLIKRRNLLKKVLEYVGNKTGVNGEWPTPRNVAEETEDSWIIRSQIK